MIRIGSIPAAWVAAVVVSGIALAGVSAVSEGPRPQEIRHRIETLKERQMHPPARPGTFPGVPEYSLRYSDDWE
jgi:hypothetical protein